MDTSYDKVISYLTEEQGLSLEEAEEIMVLCVEQGMNPTEIFGRGLIDMLNLLPKKKKVEAPKPTVAPKSVSSTSTGTPVQGKLLTKTGKAQNFTGGRTPFTGTDPVPAASSKLPQAVAPASQAPGQMRIPGMSDRAQELRNITGNPGLGLPGNKGGGLAVTGGSNATRNKSIFKAQPTRTAPELPQPPATPAAVKLKKAALPVGVAGATGLALSGGEGPKKSEDPRRPDGSLPPYTPPRPPADPAPPKKAVVPATDSPIMSSSSTYTGNNLKRPAKELSAAAKDFDRAFAAAREKGEKTFPWRGKTYTTKYKGE